MDGTCWFICIECCQNITISLRGPSWSWSYGSWMYNYLCNQFISPITFWIRIPLRARCTWYITLRDKVCQWLAANLWFSPVIPISSTNKTDRHDITDILLKVVLNTITIIILQSRWHCRRRLKLTDDTEVDFGG
jgi:hypothetical protein